MAGDETMVYVAVFGGIVLFTAVLTVVAVRVRRAGDAQTLALRASDVVAQTSDLLLGPGFLWAVWHKTADFAAMAMLIRNHRDEVVSTVVKPSAVLDDVRLSAEHTTFTTSFFEGDGTTVLFTVRSGSVLTRFLPIEAGGGEIGRLITGLRQDSTTRILTLPDGRRSRLEQVFLLAS